MSPTAAAATADGAGTQPKTTSPNRSPERDPPPYTEETPLLASRDHQSGENGHDEHEEAALLEPPQSETKRTKSWWFWRILWTVLAALLLAVFIKGWIDAKDIDVSFSCTFIVQRELPFDGEVILICVFCTV